MQTIGIDIGGTKIAAALYDAAWQVIDETRAATPDDYPGLLQSLQQITAPWRQGKAEVAIGVASAGLFHPVTGLATAANLPISGQPFAADLARCFGGPVALLNDARAFALAEALHGAGRGATQLLGITLGTGIGGGVVTGGRLAPSPNGVGGEVGHMPAPADVICAKGLPLSVCGCGQTGCVETFLAGPGLSRLAAFVLGRSLSPEQVLADRHGDCAAVWEIWSDLAGAWLHGLLLALDPEVIVLGGSLGRRTEVAEAFAGAMASRQFAGFPVPDIRIGTTAETLGAALAARARSADA